ncbi:pilus assembly PilX family protein [[Pseudomonas] boreopolis]|uniref:pilus assembly PilX family protein n=1 Tax=Xanthomonas boreopolis TaxID=86183 RepID=UPI003D9B26FB
MSGSYSRFGTPGFARRQAGAVLYIALIMLILLAIIGIVGMQVSTMQERMSSNYRNANQAFQLAEADARARECYVEGLVNRNGACSAAVTDVSQICDDGFDPTTWARDMAADVPQANRVSVRAIGSCISGNTSLAQGVGPVSEDPNPVYQITVYATSPDATANAAVDTIFRP